MAELAALAIPLITAGGTAAATAMATKGAGKAPKVQDPAPMPVPGDPSSEEARRRKQAELAASQGREATNLTPARSAAPSYSNTVLGGS